jgi:hypothetical protein
MLLRVPIPPLKIRLTVLLSGPENDGSASEEAIWLAEDTRKAGSFFGARKIRSGLDAGERT